MQNEEKDMNRTLYKLMPRKLATGRHMAVAVRIPR
jgi:hypothetical protein